MTSSKLDLYGHRVRRYIVQPGRPVARKRVIAVRVATDWARRVTDQYTGGLMHALLGFLGRLGKGKATIIGVGSIVAAAVLGTEAAEKVIVVGDAVTNILTQGGAVLGAFGVGRKAWDHAAQG